jgi:hypothetical protein
VVPEGDLAELIERRWPDGRWLLERIKVVDLIFARNGKR